MRKLSMPDIKNESDFKPDFGIKNFHTKKFENSDDDAVIVTEPVESKGIDRAFIAFCREIPLEDCFPKESNE
jgi:hypothetical protein